MSAPAVLRLHLATCCRGVLLTLSSIGWGLWGVLIIWLDRHQGRWVLLDDDLVLATIPSWLIVPLLAVPALALIALFWSLAADLRLRAAYRWLGRWIARHPRTTLFLLIVILAGALDGYELFYDPFNRRSGLFLYKLREDFRIWCYAAATILLGLAISMLWNQKPWLLRQLLRISQPRRHRPLGIYALIFLLPTLLSAALCLGALEGIPHFSDALTYLMQGRILWSGRLWLPAPQHPDLFVGSLFFLVKDGRFFGKYPIGWPAILGFFDRIHLLFLANAFLAGLAALLTTWLGRQLAGRRIGTLAGVFLALSPWLWFHGASFASHLASTVAILAFLNLLLALLRHTDPSRSQHPLDLLLALVCGLALGTAVLIRPGDAATFALPAAAFVGFSLLRRPTVWLAPALLMLAGVTAGLAVYLWTNAQLTGSPWISPYSLEGRWLTDWNPHPAAMAARIAFQWAELNHRFPGWGLGGLTLAAAGTVALYSLRSRRPLPSPYTFFIASRRLSARLLGWSILLAGTTIFFLFNTAFGFTNVWWGPRWLLPAVPLIAILAAAFFLQLLRNTRHTDPETSSAAQLGLAIALAGAIIGLTFVYGGQWWQHRLAPPHGVSTAVWKYVQNQHLTQAVVAMPPVARRAPLDARAGILFMRPPFSENPVIFVRAVPDWPVKVRQDFPNRRPYQLLPAPGSKTGFTLQRVQE